ncbi:MAG: SGNH/GDSL hydrolase family protein [Myxococcales bacterium]|nr:SGNH/GDSL hydrolase family protein [Myxococcales bacterium]
MRRLTFKPLWLVISAAFLVCSTPKPQAQPVDTHSVMRWEETIRRFERRDAQRAPLRGSVVFVGSSSLRLWKSLDEDMAPITVINRGFGGARTDDVLHYADRIVLPYAPRAIVYYAGDNDLGRDRAPTPESVTANFRRFVQRVEQSGQRPEIYFVSIKPSPTRMKNWDRMKAANDQVRALASAHPMVTYLDVAGEMLDEQGRVRPELFSSDGLHMNPRGYALWTSIIRPVLETQVGPNPLYL